MSGRRHCGRLASKHQCPLILSVFSVFSIKLSLFLEILERPSFDFRDGDSMLSIAAIVILEHGA